jgi:hypothetical protein
MPDKPIEINYNSPLWMHVEMHIQNHCFGIISEDPKTRAVYLGQDRPSQILHAIHAAADQIARRPGYPKRNNIRRLILISIQEQLPLMTVQAISAFLSSIGDYASPTALDYVASIEALSNLNKTADVVHEAVTHTSKLHGTQGQLAYDLLKSAQLLIAAAEATLQHDASYAIEKLSTAMDTVHYAEASARRWQPQMYQLETED